MLRRPGSTTELCVIANCLVEVRSLPLQPLGASEAKRDAYSEAPLFSGGTDEGALGPFRGVSEYFSPGSGLLELLRLPFYFLSIP